MSEYKQFIDEKHQLDELVSRKFRIVGLKEDLNGAWLEWEHPDGETANLHVMTANARKYAAGLLIRQVDAG